MCPWLIVTSCGLNCPCLWGNYPGTIWKLSLSLCSGPECGSRYTLGVSIRLVRASYFWQICWKLLLRVIAEWFSDSESEWISCVPADRFGCWTVTWWAAVLEGSMAEQWASCRLAQRACSLQLSPASMCQELLRLLRIRQRRVKEDKCWTLQQAPTHLTPVHTAVTSTTFEQSGVRGGHDKDQYL